MALLSDLVRDRAARWTLRAAAVESLAKLASRTAHEHVLEFASGGVEDPRVRLPALNALSVPQETAAEDTDPTELAAEDQGGE